ncbi:nickel insertion protein [Candidatus Epulonipiscium viviparus]|uniref:nickel insertion protein n=1 Tax=Candidatus Epulonipiscium viviparus TaxID=420336 RepID=UPI00016BFB36|nr:nickel insertion protein [Candidatus Epulopiscium viviparus]
MLETNIDDSTSENLGFVLEQLFELGINDAYFTSIQMKKNRPAIKLSVLCKLEKIEQVENFVFKHLSTIGIRKYKVDRTILKREIKKVKSSFGRCRVKVVTHQNETYVYPEYEDVKKISLKYDLSFNEVYNRIKNEIKI